MTPSPEERKPPPQPLDYRSPGPNPTSQWATDESPFGSCLVISLLFLTSVGAVFGLVVFIFSMISGC